MEAMIFAAGLGTRLYPLTKDKPKALVEVAGKTLLDRCIEKVIAAGCKHIVINAHHYSELIEEYISQHNYSADIYLSLEKNLLDTGGGIKEAKKYFTGKKNVLLHNVDVISEINILEMQKQLENSKSLAVLAVSQRKSSRQLLFNQENQLCGWQNTQTNEEIITRNQSPLTPLAFSGVHIVRPEFLELMPEEEKFSIINHYLMLSKTNVLSAFKHEGIMWYDLGKYEQIAEIESQIIQSGI